MTELEATILQKRVAALELVLQAMLDALLPPAPNRAAAIEQIWSKLKNLAQQEPPDETVASQPVWMFACDLLTPLSPPDRSEPPR
ncbi:MAG: hypothetical protein F9K29_07940 [Hyphomicrobiaceae bacterium]|nr:MAG: hypothetical protein F9K29_07940 [Hyphomicrobiaceae bacterium]